MLARAGAEVTMLGRPGPPGPHLEALSRGGLRMKTLTFDERVPVAVAADAGVVAGADLVLFCVKTVDTVAAAGRIRPHLREGAVVVDLQNGVDNPEKMREAGIDPIPAVVYVAAEVDRPGEVRHRGRGDLVIGHPARAADVKQAASWFRQAEVPVRIAEDIDHELWLKLIMNSMANAISALTGATYGRLACFEPAWEIAMEVAREAVEVAGAAGHHFAADEVIEQGLAICRMVGEATSSTEQDIARGRPTEIDALNGYIARRAAGLGVQAPVNRALWALVRLREDSGRDAGV